MRTRDLFSDEPRLDTLRFFRNAAEIYRRFDDWKDIDRFYFIPLELHMSYCIAGSAISMADAPVHLGTFVRNSLEHPELFSVTCRRCRRPMYAYSYNGSPMSGRVDIAAACECGRHRTVRVHGWLPRSRALRAAQEQDHPRCERFMASGGSAATVEELLDWLPL